MKYRILYGIRARLVLEILKIYDSGFTLLGDNCQAIYDFQSEEMSSKEFYKELYETFKEMEEIEYKIQKRLNPILNQKAILLRMAVKSKDEKMISSLIQQVLDSVPLIKIENIKEGAILTIKNGQVYDISRNLKIENGILNNTKEIYYASWIGWLLGDYNNNWIEKQKFQSRVIEKLNITDKNEIDNYWKYCKKIENSNNEELDIQRMHTNMIISDNTEVNNIQQDESVIISTIHKAKGKEFKNVYIDKQIENEIAEERERENIVNYAKLLYVAITRTKGDCYKVDFEENEKKKYYGKIPQEDRYFEYYYKNKNNGKGHTNKGINQIEIGLENDIDKTSFIDDIVVGSAMENIKYIKENVKKSDFVDLVFEEDNYYIYHNKRKIGKMNINDLYEKTQKYLNKVKEMTFTPKMYSNVKIKRISTIAMFQEFIPSRIQNVYAKTGMWIGIELEGFGILKWNK